MGKRRHHQGISPDQKTETQSGQRAGACAVSPVHAADHDRCELRHGRKRNEADGHERIGFAGEEVIEITEHEDAHDRRATNIQQHIGELFVLHETRAREPQQRWHDQVVADHG